MIERRLGSIVLSVTVFLAGTGCPPVVLAAGNPSGHSEVQPVVSPKAVPLRQDENVAARLLMADAVQKDLGLTADQIGKINEFAKFSRGRLRDIAARWPDFSTSGLPLAVADAQIRELQARSEESNRKQKELMTSIVGMLTPRQRARLKEIQLQQELAVGLVEPEMIRALNISDDQLARIRALSDRGPEQEQAELRESRELNSLTTEERYRRMIEKAKERNKTQAAVNRRTLDILTSVQREKLTKFVGKEIDVTWDLDALLHGD